MLQYNNSNIQVNIITFIDGKMYKKLANHIKSTCPDFPDDEINNLFKYFEVEELPKKAMFLNEGSKCLKAGYVISGCFRHFVRNSDGAEFITRFAMEDYWIGDIQSVSYGTMSNTNIEALEDSVLLTIFANDYNLLLKESIHFATFTEKKRARAMLAAETRAAEFSENAEKRYKILLSKHPDISNRVPQYLLASYLGITPESFSRMIKNIKY